MAGHSVRRELEKFDFSRIPRLTVKPQVDRVAARNAVRQVFEADVVILRSGTLTKREELLLAFREIGGQAGILHRIGVLTGSEARGIQEATLSAERAVRRESKTGVGSAVDALEGALRRLG